MDETQQYSASEMERMMKVQDVLLKAMRKRITWRAAAEILGVTVAGTNRFKAAPPLKLCNGVLDALASGAPSLQPGQRRSEPPEAEDCDSSRSGRPQPTTVKRRSCSTSTAAT